MKRDKNSSEELNKRLNDVIEKSELQNRIFKKILTKLDKKRGVRIEENQIPGDLPKIAKDQTSH